MEGWSLRAMIRSEVGSEQVVGVYTSAAAGLGVNGNACDCL